MPGLRVQSNQQIYDWLSEAKGMVDELDVPDFAYREVFNFALNVIRQVEIVVTREDFTDGVQDALQIVQSLHFPEAGLEHAFHCALTWTTEREVSVILKGRGTPNPKIPLH